MDPSYVGAVWMFAGTFAPYGFQFCDGRLLSISDNSTLYTLLGTTYGGDGVSTFALPDLRGRAVISQGQGPGLSTYVMGELAGTESVTLTLSNLAAHTHLLNAGTSATSQTPANNLYVNTVMVNSAADKFFSSGTPNATLINSSIQTAGGSIPIEIIQPVTAISFVISLYGIYPTRN